MKVLPEKYYLTHFLEFIDFIHTTSSHLLSAREWAFLNDFSQLDEQAQCMLVRIVNRKPAFVHKETLHYSEINQCEVAIQTLFNTGFLAPVDETNYQQLLPQLNKQALMALAKYCQAEAPIKSANKQTWLMFIRDHFTAKCVANDQHAVISNYVYFARNEAFQYLLFVYFARVGGRLNQFSLRDLGVMQTQSVREQQANFNDLAEAQSAFLHANVFEAIKEADKADRTLIDALAAKQLNLDQPVGFLAAKKYHHGLYQLGLAVIGYNTALGEQLLSLSLHSAAKEKYIRLLFKAGKKAQCQALLQAIIDDPDSESLLLFAEDFYAQKFERKQTSLLTDILRRSSDPIALDEAYMGQVESGVKNHYIQSGYACFFTENKLWRALFALTFWQELYLHPDAERANEFSYYPKLLKNQSFYDKFATIIAEKLAKLSDRAVLSEHISQTVNTHQGEPNGLFFWQSQLLDVLLLFIEHAPIEAITGHLLKMAQHFDSVSDGYPDLMLIKDNQVYFEEIKAPGDSLRRNQLVTIQSLSKAGFNVSIQRTQWQFDASQRYVVVDIETTGGKKDHHRITEIGLVCIEHGQVIDTWQTLVNPERSIPAMITKLTGIDNAMVKDAPTFAQIADTLDALTQHAIFVAHNVNFDYGFIKQEFARLDKRFMRAKMCTVQQARKYLPGHSSYSLGKLCHSLNIPLHNHHRALDDAQAAAAILLKINAVRADSQ